MLLLLLNSILAFTPAQSSTQDYNVRGKVVTVNHKLFLVNELQQKFEVTAGNPNVSSDLASLESGDYVAGRGDFSPGSVRIDAIEFIGLRRLLGKWIDYTNQVMFNFRDFSSAGVRTLADPQEKHLQYALVPDHANRWTIFIGDNQTVVVGMLTHFQNMVRIDLINSQSGQIERTIRLQQVRP